MPRRRTLSALLIALVITGCSQPEAANDNGPQPDPERPADVIRSTAPSPVP